MKHDAIVDQGIPIHERVPIPDEMIPADSRVEIDAKIQAGYFTTGNVMSMEELANVKGRGWEDIDVRIAQHNFARIPKLTATVALIQSHGLGRMQGRKAASFSNRAQRANCGSLRHAAVFGRTVQAGRALLVRWTVSRSQDRVRRERPDSRTNQYLDTHKLIIAVPVSISRPVPSPEGLPPPLTSSQMTFTIGGPSQRLLRSDVYLIPSREVLDILSAALSAISVDRAVCPSSLQQYSLSGSRNNSLYSKSPVPSRGSTKVQSNRI
jgi:hypothetical protein